MSDSDNMKLSLIRKSTIVVFTTNLLATVVAIFFIRAYRLKGISIAQPLVLLLIILIAFLSVCVFILKPRGKINGKLDIDRIFIILLERFENLAHGLDKVRICQEFLESQ